MKKKKLILEWEEENNENYVLGIVSSSSHLEFVHYLNQTQYFNLERDHDLELEIINDKSFFICFTNNDTENTDSYKLIKNKGTVGIVGKEFKGVDYILIHNPENSESLGTIKDILFQHKLIQAVIEIDIQKISDKTKKLLGL